METKFKNQSNKFVQAKKIYDGYLNKEKNRDSLNTDSNSVYCKGFQSFLSRGDVCNTIDAKSVYSKGLEITFVNNLKNEDIMEDGIDSKSLFEDTYGLYGTGEPILLQADIYGGEKERKPTKEKIRKALEKALAEKQLPSQYSFNDAASENVEPLFTVNMFWNKKRKVWTVKFLLTLTGNKYF